MNLRAYRFLNRPLFKLLLLSLAVALPAGAGQAETSDLPLPVRVVLSRAGGLIKAQQVDQAISQLTAFQARGDGRTGKADPRVYHHPEIYFALGTCYLLQEDYASAIKAFKAAVEKDPGHVAAWLNLAKASYEQHDYSGSAAAFQRAYQHAQEKKPQHLYYCAAAHLMAEENGPCLEAFELLFARHGDAVEPAWRENYVHALLTAGRAKAALPHIQQLARHYTGDKRRQWQEILLYQYLALEMTANALSYARELTIEDPTCAKWWKALAHVELHTGRLQPALVAMMCYSYLVPLNHEEMRLLADLNLQLGIPVKAAPLYEGALARKADAGLLQNLVMSLQQLGQPEVALETLDRFAPRVEKEADTLALLRADLLYALERFDEAARAYRQAARTGTQKAGRAWLMAGYAAWQLADIQASKFAFNKAVAHRKEKTAATAALRQLAMISVTETQKVIKKK